MGTVESEGITMFKQELGKRIRQIRVEKEMTREEFAERAELTSKFIYEVEHGKKGLSAKTLLKISQALDCSCDYILLGVSRDEDDYGMPQFNTRLLKGYSERECRILMEILQLVLMLKEERSSRRDK